MMATTKKPTGMAITRKNNKFTVTWKIPYGYAGGQQCYYSLEYGGKWGYFDNDKFVKGWKKMSCNAGTTKKTLTLDMSHFYPNSNKKKLSSVQFRVRGRKTSSDRWSAYTGKAFDLNEPKNPSVTATLSATNQTGFAWTLSTSNTNENHRYFTEVEWESVLLKDSNIKDGKKAFSAKKVAGSAQSGTSSSNSSKTITESNISDDSYTRWFRIRARGPRGASDWVYKNQVYAKPNRATNVEATCKRATGGGFNCNVEYTTSTSRARPNDETLIQYSIAVPDTGLTYPAGGSWTDATSAVYKTKNDSQRFFVNDSLDEDECLWVRVNTSHNNEITYGVPQIIRYGKLNTPTITSLTAVDSTYRVTIEATNNCTIPGSFLAVVFQGDKGRQTVVGIIPAGTSSPLTFQCPDWSGYTTKSFGVYAVVGTSSYTTKDSVRSYSFAPISGKQLMTSVATWQGGTVPQAPSNVTLTTTDTIGTVRVNWDWTWQDASGAEVSWSDYIDAWESTDPPQTYTLTNAYNGQLNIVGLDQGITWYVRVRLLNEDGEDTVFGPYSDIEEISLSSAPSIPTLLLSDPVIASNGNVTASWDYIPTDGTSQIYAEICEATIANNVVSYGNIIAHSETSQHVTIYAEDAGWLPGSTHNLCVRVYSASGEVSNGWSAPVSVEVANTLTCSLSYSGNLQSITVTDDSVDQTTKTVLGLVDMPISLTVTGAGDYGTTTVAIERADSYFLDRPDDRQIPAHAGETVALIEQMGEAAISITNEDLIGTLDDGAPYKIVATVSDTLGQRDSTEIEFEVHWTNQAKIPSGTVIIDETNLIARITPTATSPNTGDVCDIYRLSVDRPVLVYEGATFGTEYVDPFPTIGEYGGHRLVYRTANGDYTTSSDEIAWTDLTETQGDRLDSMYNVIEFGGGRVMLIYDVVLDTSWEKDFKATSYLGGSIRGDWNPAVLRSSSVTSRVVTIKDQATIEAMRRLADYTGICHVRTRDGSSYPANVDVSESYDMGQDVIAREFSITITRVDAEGFDGLTYTDWLEGVN